jgi:hypothetical protein
MNLLKFLLIYLITATAALAAPGAHGPNGEHLDGAGGQVHSDAGPRIETFTEAFELVGRLQGGELSILIDRYETNEPVLNGKLEVEFNGLKAPAKFHADLGDYSFDDARLLQALAKPGKHQLLFTLTAGDENDLLEGTLVVAAQDTAHGDAHFPWAWSVAAGLVAIVLVTLAVWLRRRKTPNRNA